MVDKRVVVYFKQVTVKGNESVLISKSFFCQQVYLKTFEYHEKFKVLDLLGLCSFSDPKALIPSMIDSVLYAFTE